MPTLAETALSAAKHLNSAYAEFMAGASSEAHREYQELKLQACIFQFDICSEMASIEERKLTGFAELVALKGMVLKLYE